MSRTSNAVSTWLIPPVQFSGKCTIEEANPSDDQSHQGELINDGRGKDCRLFFGIGPGMDIAQQLTPAVLLPVAFVAVLPVQGRLLAVGRLPLVAAQAVGPFVPPAGILLSVGFDLNGGKPRQVPGHPALDGVALIAGALEPGEMNG
jgi:hypothetical protein